MDLNVSKIDNGINSEVIDKTADKSVIELNVPELDKIFQYKIPNSITLNEEIYNETILNILIKLDPSAPGYSKLENALDISTIINLKKLKRFTKKDGHLCTYEKKINKTKKGRYYLNNFNKKDTFSYQICKSVVRKLLINGEYIYIDMCNAHIEILKNISRFLKIPENDIKILSQYCTEREKILEDIMIKYKTTRTIAKTFFIIILYGGSLNTWLFKNCLSKFKDYETQFMKDFIEAFDLIKKKITNIDIFKSFCDIEKYLSKKKDYTIESSALAIFLQEIESIIAIVIKNFCEENGCITKMIIHDGLGFSDVKKICNQEFLTKIMKHIESELGLIIPLDYENLTPTDEDIKWFENHKAFLDSCNVNTDFNEIEQGYDADASSIVLKLNKGKYISCQGELFVKNDNLWFSKNSDEYNFKKIIHKDILKANIIYETLSGWKSYSKNNSNQENCYKQILINGFENRSNFYDDIVHTSKYYLAFKDCIYCFKDNKKYSYEEKPDIYFVQRIERDFPIRNEKHIKHVYDKILNPIFDDKIQLNYFLHTIARGIAGCVEDKTWYNWVGMRNCGKSVLTMFLCKTFESYTSTFNADQLIHNKFGNPDVARAMSWFIQHWFVRLLLSNEIKETDVDTLGPKTLPDKRITLRGDLTKRLISGGKDLIDARADHGKKHYKIRPQLTMILCSNSTPTADPSNALDTLEAILFRSKFVDKEDLNTSVSAFKLKDTSVDDDIKNIDYINAFMFIIFDNFTLKRMLTPKMIIDDTILAKGGVEKCIEVFLITNFKNTEVQFFNDDTKYHTSELINIVNHNGYSVSSKVLNQKMKVLNLGQYDPKNLCKDGKKSSGYYGLEINEDILPDDD